MPTPTGRPRKGEQIFTADGKLIGTVLEVTRHKEYSVTIRPNGSKFTRCISSFNNWRTRYGWKVA